VPVGVVETGAVGAVGVATGAAWPSRRGTSSTPAAINATARTPATSGVRERGAVDARTGAAGG